MAERPIIFSAPMVRAILEGRKTQTRRVLKPQPDDLREGQIPAALRIGAGDLLWVREAWAPIYSSTPSAIYRADGDKQPGSCCGCAWRPPIFMPRWASRITLRVTDVRVQRLQGITSADAIAEGFLAHANSQTIDCDTPDPRDDFRTYWNSLNAKRGFGWETNPWVAAITFERSNADG